MKGILDTEYYHFEDPTGYRSDRFYLEDECLMNAFGHCRENDCEVICYKDITTRSNGKNRRLVVLYVPFYGFYIDDDTIVECSFDLEEIEKTIQKLKED